MNWNMWIRQTHRWLSIAFTLAVIANMVFLMQKDPGDRGSACWRLFPLILLLAAGSTCSRCHISASQEATIMKKAVTAKRPARRTGEPLPPRLIDGRIKELGDWRGEMLARIRALIKQADPDVVEEWKWRGVPVWEHDGIICTGETYKAVVKMTFAKGAALKDPAGLFNSSLEGNIRRAIDFARARRSTRRR